MFAVKNEDIGCNGGIAQGEDAGTGSTVRRSYVVVLVKYNLVYGEYRCYNVFTVN
jgi:hypothetical protein